MSKGVVGTSALQRLESIAVGNTGISEPENDTCTSGSCMGFLLDPNSDC